MKIQLSWKVRYIVFWVIGDFLMLFWNTSLDVVIVCTLGATFAALLLILNPLKLRNKVEILTQAVVITIAVNFIGAIPIEFICNHGYALYSCTNNHLDIGYPILLFCSSLFGVLIMLISLYFSLREN